MKKSGRPSKNRRAGVVTAFRSYGIPVRLVDRGYSIGGLSGVWFAFGNRVDYSKGDLRSTSPVRMLRMMAEARPRSIPILVKHDYGTPYQDAVISMRLGDVAPLLAGLIESDPARFIQNDKED